VITDKNFALFSHWKGWSPYWTVLGDTGATIKKAFDGDLMKINYSDVSLSSFSITGVSFCGAYYNPPPGSGYTGKGIIVNNSHSFEISYCTIRNFADDALTLTDGGLFTLERTYIYEIYGHGIYLKDMGQDWWIINTEVDIGVSYTEPDRCALFIETGCSSGHISGGHYEGYNGLSTDSSLNCQNIHFPWAYNSSVVYGRTVKLGGVMLRDCNIDGGNQAQQNDTSGGHPSTVYWNVSYGKIIGCNLAGRYNAYCIYEEDGNNYNDISHNQIYMSNQTGNLVRYIRKISPYTYIHYNGQYYNTQYEGRKYIADGQTSATFVHNIKYSTATETIGMIPNIVLITFNDEPTGIWWYEVTSTNITVYMNASASGDTYFSWDARFTTTTP